jgi:hypothetical protein
MSACLAGDKGIDFDGVGFVVAGGMCLAHLEGLAWRVGGVLREVRRMIDMVIAGHFEGSGG